MSGDQDRNGTPTWTAQDRSCLKRLLHKPCMYQLFVTTATMRAVHDTVPLTKGTEHVKLEVYMSAQKPVYGHHHHKISHTSHSWLHTRLTGLKKMHQSEDEGKERRENPAPPVGFNPKPLAIRALCWGGATGGRPQKWALILWKSTQTPKWARSDKPRVYGAQGLVSYDDDCYHVQNVLRQPIMYLRFLRHTI